MGLRTPNYIWFLDYLFNRSHQLQYKGCFSAVGRVTSGVPQGSILGPLLFIAFFNDFTSCLKHSNVTIYADDTVIYVAGKDIFIIEIRLSSDMELIVEWWEKNELILNTTTGKTESMLFGTAKNLRQQAQSLNVTYRDQLIRSVTTYKYLNRLRCFGYCYLNSIKARHWFQFADDTAIVTTTVEDNQLLLNIFERWCSWAGLSINGKMCSTFGIKKSVSKSTQFKPYLKISNKMIPPVEMGESFTCLGKHSNFKMQTSLIECELESKLVKLLEKIHQLPLHPKNKIIIVMRYVYSKLRWRLSIYDFSQTWVVRNLDDKVIRYVKDWLHFHQGANLGHIKLSISKFGFGFQLPLDVCKFCKLSTRVILKKSKNKEIRALFKTTSTSNIAIDSVIVNNKDNPNLALKHQIENNGLECLAGLTEQNALMQHMKMEATSKQISTWKRLRSLTY